MLKVEVKAKREREGKRPQLVYVDCDVWIQCQATIRVENGVVAGC